MFVILLILKITLFIILALVALLMLFMVLPVTYSGQLLTSDGFKASCRFGWPWRVFSIKGTFGSDELVMGVYLGRLRLMKLKTEKREAIEEVKEEVEEVADKIEEKVEKSGLRSLINKSLINELIAYIKKVLKVIKPKYLHIKGRYGFEDPSITGMASGIVGIINACVPHAKLQLYPEFTEEVMDFDLLVEGRMQMGTLAYHTLRTVLKKDIRKILFNKGKKSKKVKP